MTEGEAHEAIKTMNAKLGEALRKETETDGTTDTLVWHLVAKDYRLAIISLRMQIPKKPLYTDDREFALCPCCEGRGLLSDWNYCPNCGQAIDWGQEND